MLLVSGTAVLAYLTEPALCAAPYSITENLNRNGRSDWTVPVGRLTTGIATPISAVLSEQWTSSVPVGTSSRLHRCCNSTAAEISTFM